MDILKADVSSYDSHLCELVTMMMEVGGTLKDVSEVLQVPLKTLEMWRKKYPEFDETIKEGLKLSTLWNDTCTFVHS